MGLQEYIQLKQNSALGFAECYYAECNYAVCRWVECRGAHLIAAKSCEILHD
jgi:hypothetical protein